MAVTNRPLVNGEMERRWRLDGAGVVEGREEKRSGGCEEQRKSGWHSRTEEGKREKESRAVRCTYTHSFIGGMDQAPKVLF